MCRPTVLVGCGLPAVGKTAVLRALQRCSPGSLYLDKDTINVALLSHGNHEYFSDYYDRHVRNQTYSVMFALAKDNLIGGCPLVILDGQFGDKLSTAVIQEPLQSLRENTKCDVKIVYCYCSLEGQLQRMKARGEPRDDAKYEVLQTLRAGWLDAHRRELAGVDHLRLDTEALSVTECVSRIQSYIRGSTERVNQAGSS